MRKETNKQGRKETNKGMAGEIRDKQAGEKRDKQGHGRLGKRQTRDMPGEERDKLRYER